MTQGEDLPELSSQHLNVVTCVLSYDDVCGGVAPLVHHRMEETQKTLVLEAAKSRRCFVFDLGIEIPPRPVC